MGVVHAGTGNSWVRMWGSRKTQVTVNQGKDMSSKSALEGDNILGRVTNDSWLSVFRILGIMPSPTVGNA
jgi:hypothetical protein